MSSIIGRSAFRATRALRASGVTSGAGAAEKHEAGRKTLQTGAKRDPELYVLFTIMCGAFSLVGWHFSRSPTSSSSENPVAKVPGSEPWNTGGSGKYEYHPGGDTSQGGKEAPSALNTVIIPNVNLPKELHEKYNKWGKEEYEY